MQRWWFNDEKSKTSEETAQFDATNQSNSVPSNSSGSGQPERKHTFRVLVNQHLDPNEVVAVTGECFNLGQWIPAKCVQLSRENGKCEKKCVCFFFFLSENGENAVKILKKKIMFSKVKYKQSYINKGQAYCSLRCVITAIVFFEQRIIEFLLKKKSFPSLFSHSHFLFVLIKCATIL